MYEHTLHIQLSVLKLKQYTYTHNEQNREKTSQAILRH